MTHRKVTIGIAAVAATMAFATVAQANVKNSIAPGRLFFGQVTSGVHPNRLVTLTNHTGAPRRIKTIAIAGSGGFVFTLPKNALTDASPYPRCVERMVLAAGARCVLDVRVHTVRVGWWRSTLRIAYRNGWNNSASLEAHVVPGPTAPARSTQPGSCTSLATLSAECGS